MIKVIFWDFDGVLIDSNSIRDLGFRRVLSSFPKLQIEQLLAFHQANGGLSRYIKFRYFFEEIRKEQVTQDEILLWAERFSVIMKDLLVNPNLLIQETLTFVRRNQGKYIMHITSGSDQEELRFLCKSLGIDLYFTSIHGSPRSKKELVNDLMQLHAYEESSCVLIGDSINDWEAAMFNKIYFQAYNNEELIKFSNLKLV